MLGKRQCRSKDVDVLAGNAKNVVKTTEADVNPTVATEDPEGLLGEEALAKDFLSSWKVRLSKLNYEVLKASLEGCIVDETQSMP